MSETIFNDRRGPWSDPDPHEKVGTYYTQVAADGCGLAYAYWLQDGVPQNPVPFHKILNDMTTRMAALENDVACHPDRIREAFGAGFGVTADGYNGEILGENDTLDEHIERAFQEWRKGGTE